MLRAGERVDADFTLTAAQAVALTLAAKNPVIVRLSSEGIGGVPVFHHGEDSPSTIHVYNLIPGRYTVWFGPRGTDPPSIQVIDLGHQDTTIDLAPSPPARVSVECATDGARPGGLGLVITSEDNLHGAGRMIAGGPRIEYPPLSAGRYRFRLMGQGADRAYLDILSSEGGRFEDGVLEITPGESIKVRAVVSTRGGRVEGKVYRGGRPLAGAMVFLAPRRAGEQSRYPAFTTDSDGSFEYPAVKPGDYVVYAFDEDLDIEYAVPSVAERDARASRIVRVEAGGSVDLRLDLTSPQPAPASAGPQAEGR